MRLKTADFWGERKFLVVSFSGIDDIQLEPIIFLNPNLNI